MNKIEKGLLFLQIAQRVLARDFDAAFKDKDWNIAIRRAQEASEYAVKALYLLAEQDPPELHEPPLRKLFSQIRLKLGNILNLKHASFVFEFNSEHHIVLSRVTNGTYTQLACASGLGIDPTKPAVISAVRQGSGALTVKVSQGGSSISITDSRALISSEHNDELKQMSRYVKELAEDRNPSFYFDKQFGENDATQARLRAEFVVRKILDLLGTPSNS